MIRATRNAEYTKEYNRKMFLRLLRVEPMFRAEIARRMGLTRAATSLIAEELLSEGLIRETVTTEKRMGRTPVPLMISPEAGYAIGVYLNRDGCTAGLVSMNGKVLGKKRVRLGEGMAQEKVALVADAIREMVSGSNIPREKIVGVGVSAPGPLDGESGRILNPPRFDLWHDTQIGTMLQESLNMPIYLENNASCLARYNYGKPEAGGSEDFLLLLVDSGIGSGVVSHGKVLKGAGYFTSELGHSSIDFRGRHCDCGNIGCLEAYASVPNLLKNTSFQTWKDLIDQQLFNEEARNVLQQEAEYLAAGIINMAHMVSIDTVLLAGDIYYGAEYFAPIVEEIVNSRMLRREILPIRVLPSCSSPDATVLAAADVAFGRFLMV